MQSSGAGWLSLVDNQANDETYIYADFYGPRSGELPELSCR